MRCVGSAGYRRLREGLRARQTRGVKWYVCTSLEHDTEKTPKNGGILCQIGAPRQVRQGHCAWSCCGRLSTEKKSCTGMLFWPEEEGWSFFSFFTFFFFSQLGVYADRYSETMEKYSSCGRLEIPARCNRLPKKRKPSGAEKLLPQTFFRKGLNDSPEACNERKWKKKQKLKKKPKTSSSGALLLYMEGRGKEEMEMCPFFFFFFFPVFSYRDSDRHHSRDATRRLGIFLCDRITVIKKNKEWMCGRARSLVCLPLFGERLVLLKIWNRALEVHCNFFFFFSWATMSCPRRH